jgi:hypothetical protein
MADEPAKIILGDTAITAIERTPGPGAGSVEAKMGLDD